MRVSEDKDVEGAGLVDCWKAAGSSKDTKFTWNSYRNKDALNIQLDMIDVMYMVMYLQ